MSAFFVSFGLIFVAELGDKSQLVALWSATRYRWWLVIIGVALATLVVHLGSTAIGGTAADVLPEEALYIIVGLSFYGFAAWSLRGDTLEEGPKRTARTALGALWLVTSAFFVSELGDKTQLATVSIAGNEDDFIGVWLGSTLGMVAADALAIGAGTLAGSALSPRRISVAAALLFATFGTLALIRAGLLLLG